MIVAKLALSSETTPETHPAHPLRSDPKGKPNSANSKVVRDLVDIFHSFDAHPNSFRPHLLANSSHFRPLLTSDSRATSRRRPVSETHLIGSSPCVIHNLSLTSGPPPNNLRRRFSFLASLRETSPPLNPPLSRLRSISTSNGSLRPRFLSPICNQQPAISNLFRLPKANNARLPSRK